MILLALSGPEICPLVDSGWRGLGEILLDGKGVRLWMIAN